MALRHGKNSELPVPRILVPRSAGERTVVVRAFRALPAAHREILTETLFRERTVDQAAAVLGVPVETVKVRVYHALRALRVALDTPDH
ncbi:sigma factor-like helix-turn-helix DNA-binding protein [Actinomadura hibisca]|uniref:sigma factor-like helix-turn-helix DNA-binding protein n=1 Tax=Actinomadura hibisca TaxID=68565 RepID=UPI0008364D94|nr:sigma factor-like helix-turn-helix DNA-binding protein [Actinomadura hibisca]